MLAWKAAKEVPTRILVASADVGALGFMVERVREFVAALKTLLTRSGLSLVIFRRFFVVDIKHHGGIYKHRVGIGG